MIGKYKKRFEELEEQIADVKKTLYHDRYGFERVAEEIFIEWRIKVKNLLSNSCGKDSEHYKKFDETEQKFKYDSNFSTFVAIFKAAKDDYFGGYLDGMEALVQAEVFDSQLEQAQELLDKGYHVAAAVIAGTVLETSLRDLCKNNDIEIGKLNIMNEALAKKGVYSILRQKRITALADIRNNAAHGNNDKFTEQDVADMIKQIEALLACNFSNE